MADAEDDLRTAPRLELAQLRVISSDSSQIAVPPPPSPPVAISFLDRIRTVTTMPNVEVMQKTHAYTNVVNELVGTEQDYVRDLEFLIDNVQTPMSESDWVSRAEITALFGGLEGIKGVNDILLSQLETARDEDGLLVADACSVIAHAFLEMSAYLKMYTTFVRSREASMQVLLDLRRRPEFLSFVRSDCPELGAMGLESYLIKPIQRICKYPLLLREICRAMDPQYHTEDEIGIVEKAWGAVDGTVASINEKKRLFEDQAASLEIAGKIDGLPDDLELISAARWLMSEGDCKLTIGGKARQRHYYLFSDLLIFTKKYRSPFTLGRKPLIFREFNYKSHCLLEEILVNDVSAPDFALEIVDAPRQTKYTIVFPSAAEKEVIRRNLVEAVEATHKVRRRRNSGVYTSAEEAASTSMDASAPDLLTGNVLHVIPVLADTPLTDRALAVGGSFDPSVMLHMGPPPPLADLFFGAGGSGSGAGADSDGGGGEESGGASVSGLGSVTAADIAAFQRRMEDQAAELEARAAEAEDLSERNDQLVMLVRQLWGAIATGDASVLSPSLLEAVQANLPPGFVAKVPVGFGGSGEEAEAERAADARRLGELEAEVAALNNTIAGLRGTFANKDAEIDELRKALRERIADGKTPSPRATVGDRRPPGATPVAVESPDGLGVRREQRQRSSTLMEPARVAPVLDASRTIPDPSSPRRDRSKTSAQASSPGERIRGRASTVATSADAAGRDIGARIAAHLEVIEAYINRHKQALIHFMTKDREFRSAAKAEFALLRGWFARDSARMYRSYMAALLAANAAKIEREKLVVGIVKYLRKKVRATAATPGRVKPAEEAKLFIKPDDFVGMQNSIMSLEGKASRLDEIAARRLEVYLAAKAAESLDRRPPAGPTLRALLAGIELEGKPGWFESNAEIDTATEHYVADERTATGRSIVTFAAHINKPSKGWDVDVASILQFVRDTTDRLCTSLALTERGDSDRMRLMVERTLYPRITARIVAPSDAARASDEAYVRQIAWLRSQPPKAFEIDGYTGDEFAEVSTVLTGLSFEAVPLDLLQTVVDAFSLLEGICQETNAGADTLFPMLVFATIHAVIAQPFALVAFVREFGGAAADRGQRAYCFTTFEAALQYIRKVTPEDLVYIPPPLIDLAGPPTITVGPSQGVAAEPAAEPFAAAGLIPPPSGDGKPAPTMMATLRQVFVLQAAQQAEQAEKEKAALDSFEDLSDILHRAHRDSVLLAAEAVDAIFAPSAEALEGQRAAAAAALGDAREGTAGEELASANPGSAIVPAVSAATSPSPPTTAATAVAEESDDSDLADLVGWANDDLESMLAGN